ncbi:MAG: hypothetical protein ACO3MF_04630 [Acholeplasmataceae bacterium]
MAKKVVKKESFDKPKTEEHYKMPYETLWGKIVLWLLLVGMVGGVIISFIVALISGQA